MSEWTEIVELAEIPVLGSRVIRTDTMDIAIFRTAEDQVFAIKDQCPPIFVLITIAFSKIIGNIEIMASDPITKLGR